MTLLLFFEAVVFGMFVTAIGMGQVSMFHSPSNSCTHNVWKKLISILKSVHFSSKGRQIAHTVIHIMGICRMLISYIKLDDTLFLIDYSNNILLR